MNNVRKSQVKCTIAIYWNGNLRASIRMTNCYDRVRRDRIQNRITVVLLLLWILIKPKAFYIGN